MYNVLYARVAMDWAFLDRVMGAEEGVGKVDVFMGDLWKGWRGVRDRERQGRDLGESRAEKADEMGVAQVRSAFTFSSRF